MEGEGGEVQETHNALISYPNFITPSPQIKNRRIFERIIIRIRARGIGRIVHIISVSSNRGRAVVTKPLVVGERVHVVLVALAGARAVVRVSVNIEYVDNGGGGGEYEAESYEGSNEGRNCEEKKKKEKEKKEEEEEEEEEKEEEMMSESCEAWLHDGGKEPELFLR